MLVRVGPYFPVLPVAVTFDFVLIGKFNGFDCYDKEYWIISSMCKFEIPYEILRMYNKNFEFGHGI
jgi:hypothetical protein